MLFVTKYPDNYNPRNELKRDINFLEMKIKRLRQIGKNDIAEILEDKLRRLKSEFANKD